MMRRLEIAQALANRPKGFILRTKHRARPECPAHHLGLIKKLRDEFNTTLMMTITIWARRMSFATASAIMDRGTATLRKPRS